MKTSLNSV